MRSLVPRASCLKDLLFSKLHEARYTLHVNTLFIKKLYFLFVTFPGFLSLAGIWQGSYISVNKGH